MICIVSNFGTLLWKFEKLGPSHYKFQLIFNNFSILSWNWNLERNVISYSITLPFVPLRRVFIGLQY